MQVTEIHVPLESLEDVFRIVKKEIDRNPNTQVYVAEDFFSTPKQCTYYCTFDTGFGVTCHYYSWSGEGERGGIEEWWCFKDNDERSYFSFVPNCMGYRQLVRLCNKKEIVYKEEYCHYEVGLEQFLLIEVQKA